MKEIRILTKLVKVISDVVATVTLVAGVLVVIATIQYSIAGSGEIAVFGGMKFHGLVEIEGYSQQFLMQMMIVLFIFCFLEAAAAFLVSICSKKILSNTLIFCVDNIKRTRKVGILITVLFAVFLAAITAFVGYNELIANQEYAEEFMRKIYSISTISLEIGVFFILFSVFIKAGYEECSTKK